MKIKIEVYRVFCFFENNYFKCIALGYKLILSAQLLQLKFDENCKAAKGKDCF